MRRHGSIAILLAIICASAQAGPPTVASTNAKVTLDGSPLGTAIANRSAYATILFDTASSTYHMWVSVADETPPGTTPADFVPLRIAGYRHATSSDGVAFVSTGTLSFAGNPFATQIFGSTFGEPPWFYPKAALWNGRYTLLMWTINGFWGVSPSLGDYNYNVSVNDIGSNPSSPSLTHYGPVGAAPGNGIDGQTAGVFGVVSDVMYYDNNSLLGRAPLTDNGPQAFPSAGNTGPWRVTATNSAVADPLTALGFVACQFPGGNTYVHNDARVIDNGDGTLGWIFTLRNCDGSRKSQQIYYMQSADNGLTWSNPVGIVTGPVTIGGVTPSGGFALSDVVVVGGQRIVYFNAPDSSGNLIVGGSQPQATRIPSIPVDDWRALGATILALSMLAALAVPRGSAREGR